MSSRQALDQAERTLLASLNVVRDARANEEQLARELEAWKRRCEEEAHSRQRVEQELAEAKQRLQVQEAKTRQMHSSLARTQSRLRAQLRPGPSGNGSISPLHLRGGVLPLPLSRAASFTLPEGMPLSASEAGDGLAPLPTPEASQLRSSADGLETNSQPPQFKRSYTMDISGLVSMLTVSLLRQETMTSPTGQSGASFAADLDNHEQPGSPFGRKVSNASSSKLTMATKGTMSTSTFLSEEEEMQRAGSSATHSMMAHPPSMSSVSLVDDDGTSGVGLAAAAAVAAAAARAWATAASHQQRHTRASRSNPNIWDASSPTNGDVSDVSQADSSAVGHSHGGHAGAGAHGQRGNHPHPHRKSKAGYKLVASVYREPAPGPLRKSPSQVTTTPLQPRPSSSLQGASPPPSRATYPGQPPSRTHSLSAHDNKLDGAAGDEVATERASSRSLPAAVEPGGHGQTGLTGVRGSPGADSQASLATAYPSVGSLVLDSGEGDLNRVAVALSREGSIEMVKPGGGGGGSAVGGYGTGAMTVAEPSQVTASSSAAPALVFDVQSANKHVVTTAAAATASGGRALPPLDSAHSLHSADAGSLLTDEGQALSFALEKRSLVREVAQVTADVLSSSPVQVGNALLAETGSSQLHGSFALEEPATKSGHHLGITVPVDSAVGHSVPAKVAGAVPWASFNETHMPLPSPLYSTKPGTGLFNLPASADPTATPSLLPLGGDLPSPGAIPLPTTNALLIPPAVSPLTSLPSLARTSITAAPDMQVEPLPTKQPSIASEGAPRAALATPQLSELVKECSTCDTSTKSSALTLHWLSPPQTVLVVCKLAPAVYPLLNSVIRWLRDHHMAVYVEPAAYGHVDSELRPEPTTTTSTTTTISTTGQQQDMQQQCLEASNGNGTDGSGRLVSGGSEGEPAWSVLSWPEGRCANNSIPDEVVQTLDFVVVLGGDGTLLWTCHVFGNRAVPPLLPFNMGSLGFLTPFSPAQINHMMEQLMQGGFPMILRHRLHATIVRAPRDGEPAAGDVVWADGHSATEKVVLNEVVVDRGISPFLTNLECFCDGNFVTHVQGDGLIISTPTGSTAYSLAAGGSMVHPQVPGILFTPVCPHSLSFRPLVFPDHVQLCIQVPNGARSQMYCSFDGKDRVELNAGDAVIIRMSQWPIPTVCSPDPSRDWFTGIREGLHWNTRLVQAGAGH